MAARKYPWEEWFGKPRTVVRRGIDYQISQGMMYQTIRNNASMRRMRVHVEDIGTGMVINVLGEIITDVVPHPYRAPIADEPSGRVEKNDANEEDAAPRD